MTTIDQEIALSSQHIGDGVYVSCDGYHLWLAANHHENKVVALEPSVLKALCDYATNINKAFGTSHFSGSIKS
jgi:hypothetical protein